MIRLIINALVILGVWEATAPDMLLGQLALRAESKLGKSACKPLFSCAVCMSSVWGIAFLCFGRVRILKPIWHILSLAGLMKLIVTWMKK